MLYTEKDKMNSVIKNVQEVLGAYLLIFSSF